MGICCYKDEVKPAEATNRKSLKEGQSAQPAPNNQTTSPPLNFMSKKDFRARVSSNKNSADGSTNVLPRHNLSALSLKSRWGSGVSKDDIRKVYQFGKKLGQGYAGTVYLANYINDKSRLYAIKSVEVTSLTSEAWQSYMQELDLIKEVDCQHIVSFFECYQSEKECHLVLEYCEGGDLVSYVENTDNGVHEELAKKWFWQACVAINYLHRYGIAHRDIKLDNFLLTKKDPWKSDSKLIDFGFAKRVKEGLTTKLGTPYYVAPEVLERNPRYTEECDNWSLGIFLHMLLFAEIPFNGNSNNAIFDAIATKEINYNDKRFSNVSPYAVDIMKGLLNKNPSKRLTLKEVLASPWFNTYIKDFDAKYENYLTPDLMKRVRMAPKLNNLQREVTKLMVNIFYDHPEVQKRKMVFSIIDTERNGVLSIQELSNAFKKVNIEMTEAQINTLLDSMRLRSEHVLTVTEFVGASLDPGFYKDKNNLKAAFDRIDVDLSGSISFDNIRSCFERFGYYLDDKVAKGFLQDFDISADGQIDYWEFEKMMVREPDVSPKI